MTGQKEFRQLYKIILRLHRGLPPDMRAVGDEYVRSEFRRHKEVKAEELTVFFKEWVSYSQQLSHQLRLRGPQTSDTFGTDLSMTQLDMFRDEQLAQLYELKQETSKAFVTTKKK